jgi:hypothetical protein
MAVRIKSSIIGVGLAASFAMCAACWPLTVQAQESATKKLERSVYRAQFAGWTGIVFRCIHDPKRTFEKHVCDAVTKDARSLAKAAKVPFRFTRSQSYAAAAYDSAQIGSGLIVEADVSSSATSGFIGVVLRIQAGNSYGNVVDRKAAPGTPQATPRGGTLVLWEKTEVACGVARPAFEQVIAVRLEGMFGEFFNRFIDNRQAPVWKHRAKVSKRTANGSGSR